MVPTEGVEPTHSREYQILSLARLPIPPHRQPIKSTFSGLPVSGSNAETCHTAGIVFTTYQ